MKNDPLSILLIEDSPTDALLLNEKLRQVSELVFEVECADTLGAGIRRLIEHRYDAVILDLSLPDSFGLSTLERVRHHNKQVPIIIVSGKVTANSTVSFFTTCS